MQIASILVSLGGDPLNQVSRYDVTPAEMLLLQALHGSDAVTEITVVGDVGRNSSAERDRLFGLYSRMTPDRGRTCPELDNLFPGLGARLPDAFGDLNVDEAFYARRQIARDPLDHDEDGRKGGSKKGGVRKGRQPAIKTPDADASAADEEQSDEDETSEDGGQNLFK